MSAQPSERGLDQSAAPASVTRDEVRHVAALASLELTAVEEERMERDLNAILGYVAELNQLDTSKIEPMTQVSEILVASSSSRDAAQNTPDSGAETAATIGKKIASESSSGGGRNRAAGSESLVLPSSHSVGVGACHSPNALRADQPRPSLPRSVVMAQAPATDGTFFKVPKVIER